MTKKKKKEYKAFSFRLADETVQKLDEIRGDRTWNKFFVAVIREKEGEECYFCGKVGNLEIHHVIARKDGGTDDKENLVLLCVSCHKKTENWGNRKV